MYLLSVFRFYVIVIIFSYYVINYFLALKRRFNLSFTIYYIITLFSPPGCWIRNRPHRFTMSAVSEL